jgi:energy-coupling factor transporter ATP-binding protein EcfA2/energy-coupling factor transporter transmembrane protein EcfT
VPEAPRGPLQPPELATAAVLGGLTVALTIFGWFVPYASAVSILAAVPMAITAFRCRPRAVLASAVAAAGVSFLLAGTGPLAGVAACAVVGGLVGHARRRSWGAWRTMAASIWCVTPIFAVACDAALAALPSLRRLTLAQLRNSLHGLTNLVAGVPHLGPGAKSVDHAVNTALRYWWASVPVGLTLFAVGLTFMTYYLSIGILSRLESVPRPDLLDDGSDPEADGTPQQAPFPNPSIAAAGPGPVPAQLTVVSYRYDGADDDALHDLSLRVDPGELLTVVGHNGSGKSTLVRLLAGRVPTSGSITRPGAVGLGRMGGTALVSQRPESQVLGVRVADDVVWGLPSGTEVDVSQLLDTVGLKGMEDRDTSTLSGGELQRLTVAGALAHRPRLLLSDESTAMVDGEGRRALMSVLSELPRSQAMAVVHVTHRPEEAAAAHSILRLERGRVVPAARSTTVAPAAAAYVSELRIRRWLAAGDAPAPALGVRGGVGVAPGPRDEARAGVAPGPVVLGVAGVSHVYAERTPWAHRALDGIDLEVRAGEGVLVVGGNGSGKSTLAWVMAGLTRPTEGECLLDGHPVARQVGRVGLAFQHARLQLQRATVRADVRHAGGVDAAAADAALELVGLDPVELGDRPIDRLSGGQMRRVALAGILARRPRVLILDEPMAGLDVPARESLCQLLADLRAHAGLTLVVISHDLEGMDTVCDRIVELRDGRVVADRALAVVPAASLVSGGATVAGQGMVRAPETGGSGGVALADRDNGASTPGPVPSSGAGAPPGRARRRGDGRRRRYQTSFVLLRRVEVDSPIHRLWAGSKLLTVAALSLTLSIRPSWSTTAIVAAVVLGSAWAAHIPLRAVPRVPLAFWALVLVGAGTTLLAGGKPYVHIGGGRLGLGDLNSYTLFTLLSFVLFAASLMVGWTTALADVAPALVRLGRPLRALRLPVDEWAVTMALCVRSLPLLVEELRTLVAARRLRPPYLTADGKRDRIVDAVDLCAASLVVALRRADEMGDAIRARGGTANFSARAVGPARRDAVALTLAAMVCAGCFFVPT